MKKINLLKHIICRILCEFIVSFVNNVQSEINVHPLKEYSPIDVTVKGYQFWLLFLHSAKAEFSVVFMLMTCISNSIISCFNKL